MKKYAWITIGIFIIFSMMTVSNASAKKSFTTIVSTNYGMVQGYVDEDFNTLVWKGVPYAKPPVGELRWSAPLDPDPWGGVLSTVEDCDECAQMGVDPLTWAPLDPIGSEDCLYLNIYRPMSKMKKLPVYVWIHGGSNNYGTIKEYDGSKLASRSNVVVVTIQYRLGPLGWLTHPALRDDEGVLDASGNFGTMDTFKALEWIQKNIASFGGNPKNVLITGESAGAHNVVNCVISPLSKDLFHKAMSQSGGMKTVTMDAGDSRTEGLIAGLMDLDGAPYPGDVEAYLRGKDTYDLIEGYWHALSGAPGSSAHRDGIVIPEGGVVATIESGNYNKVPIILGSNEDEMKFFVPLYGLGAKYAYLDPFSGVFEPIPSGAYTWTDLFGAVAGVLTVDDVLPTPEDKALYAACADFGSLNWRYNFVDLLARPLSEQQNHVYAYLFKWDGEEGSAYDFTLGAAHATEIPFFFGSGTDIFGGLAFSPGNDTLGRQDLSDAMMDYLSKFAHTGTGNPNGSGLPAWKKWSNKEGKDKVIVFDATETEIDIYMIDEEITAAAVSAKFGELYSAQPAETQNIMYWFYWY